MNIGGGKASEKVFKVIMEAASKLNDRQSRFDLAILFFGSFKSSIRVSKSTSRNPIPFARVEGQQT